MEVNAESTICNVCLNLVQSKFEKIDEILIKTCQVLLLELSSVMTGNLVICQRCMGDAKKCLKFKCSIAIAQMSIVSTACKEENVKHNMRQLLYEAYNDTSCKILVQQRLPTVLCRFCLVRLSADKAVSIDDRIKEVILKGFPELDISMIENPTICIDCWNCLQAYIKFATNLLQTKNKLIHFQKERGYDSLNRLPFKNPIDVSLDNKPNIISDTQNINYNFEIEEIKPKVVFKQTLTNATSLLTQHEDTYESFYNNPKNKNRYKDPYNQKCRLNNHMVIHKDVTEINSSKSKDKGIFTKHITHQDFAEIGIYRCDQCSYKTKIKSGLRKHMLVHREVAETDMHKCDKCPFKTKRKDSFSHHKRLAHRTETDMSSYKCDQCSYRTKMKCNLTRHMLVHQEVAEIDMYNCDKCHFKTKRKDCFTNHNRIVHCAETDMYKCSQCSFKAKGKPTFKSHMILHQRIAEIDMYTSTSSSGG